MGKGVAWAVLIAILLVQIYPSSAHGKYIMSNYDCYHFPHHVQDPHFKNIHVSQNGYFTTVQSAVDSIPPGNTQRVKIFIPAGTYMEKVMIPSNKSFVSFIGDGIGKTILTWHDSAATIGSNGQRLGTAGSTSTTIESDYFCARGITFENTAPAALPGTDDMQAVALRVAGDKAVFKECEMVGHQDTLYDHSGRHFFWNCYIRGSIDFVCGNARSLYKNCSLISNAESWGAVAASHSLPDKKTGFSFVNCNVRGSGSVYLGRAWSENATIIYYSCHFDNIIRPERWDDMNNQSRRSSTMFGEFSSRGAGRDKNCSGEAEGKRVEWVNCISADQVQPYRTHEFIEAQDWLSPSLFYS